MTPVNNSTEETDRYLCGEPIDGWRRWSAQGRVRWVQGGPQTPGGPMSPTSLWNKFWIHLKLIWNSSTFSIYLFHLPFIYLSSTFHLLHLWVFHRVKARFLERKLMRMPQMWTLPTAEDPIAQDITRLCRSCHSVRHFWCWIVLLIHVYSQIVGKFTVVDLSSNYESASISKVIILMTQKDQPFLSSRLYLFCFPRPLYMPIIFLLVPHTVH